MQGAFFFKGILADNHLKLWQNLLKQAMKFKKS